MTVEIRSTIRRLIFVCWYSMTLVDDLDIVLSSFLQTSPCLAGKNHITTHNSLLFLVKESSLIIKQSWGSYDSCCIFYFLGISKILLSFLSKEPCLNYALEKNIVWPIKKNKNLDRTLSWLSNSRVVFWISTLNFGRCLSHHLEKLRWIEEN